MCAFFLLLKLVKPRVWRHLLFVNNSSDEMNVKRPLVAILKSFADDRKLDDDPYLVILRQNGMGCLGVPTLAFQFQLQQLSSCLQQPDSYLGNSLAITILKLVDI